MSRKVFITHANIIDNEKEELSNFPNWESFFWDTKEYDYEEQVTDPTGKLIFDYSLVNGVDSNGQEIELKFPTARNHIVKKFSKLRKQQVIIELYDIQTTEDELVSYLTEKSYITFNQTKFRFTRFEGWIPEFEILLKNNERMELKINLFY